MPILMRGRDSTDDTAAASYPGDPGYESSRFLHAAACLRRIMNRRRKSDLQSSTATLVRL